MKKFKADGGVKLCFEKGHCETMLDFKDVPLHYTICNASNENMPFQGKCLLNKCVDTCISNHFTCSCYIHCIFECIFSSKCFFDRFEL